MFTIYEEALGQTLHNKMVPGLGQGDLSTVQYVSWTYKGEHYTAVGNFRIFWV